MRFVRKNMTNRSNDSHEWVRLPAWIAPHV